MEYAQITMDEYLGMKKDIHESIGKILKNFIRIGKALHQIDQAQAYRNDGYKSLAEFAKAEYDMNAGGVSRFVGVYRKYCDGDALKQGYENYTYAQLVEMLNLPGEDESLIHPKASREDIRDLKRFNKEGENDIHALENWKEPEEEKRRYLKEMLVILFQKKDRESDFDEICKGLKRGSITREKFSEYVNPSGSRTIRNGRTMTFLFENEIRMKIWGEDEPAVFSYEELQESFQEQFEKVLEAESDWWNRQFREVNGKELPQENKPEKTEIAPAQKAVDPPGEERETEIKKEETAVEGSVREADGPATSGEQDPKKEEPGQEKTGPDGGTRDDQEEKAEKEKNDQKAEEKQIPGQDTILNHPEYLPKDYQTDVQVDGEPVPAAVELTMARRKEECLSLISTIQGNVTLEKYGDAYQAAGQLLTYLEVMKC